MMRKSGVTSWGIAVVLFASVLSQTGRSSGRAVEGPRVCRVGVDHSPPFYLVHKDGIVTGLAVEVLNEAARRRKISLQWVPLTDTPIDDALGKRIVDLWPLAGPTPFRQAQFYLSKPWIYSNYVLLSLGSRPIHSAADAAGKPVAHARLRMTASIAQRYLPASTLLVQHSRENAVQSVCAGQAVAALVESALLDAILLNRPEGCESQDFKLSTLSGASSPLSIMAVPEARNVAAELRDEVSNLARDGFLGSKLDDWTPLSAQGARSIWALEAAETWSNFYCASAWMILAFSAILGMGARRTFLLKRAAQGGEERYRNLTLQQEQTLAELQASEDRWQLALNGSGEGLWDWDLVSGSVFRSPCWKTMLGYAEHEIASSEEGWSRLVHPEDLERARDALAAHLNRQTPGFSCDYRLLAKDGSWRWVSDRGQAVWDEHEIPVRIAGSQTDITARKLEQETLSLEARTDVLTGLWNRREFDRLLVHHIRAAREFSRPFCLCAFDLDQFKCINDRFGHATGDLVLRRFGSLLREGLRRQDVSCRLGGDEFVVILPERRLPGWRCGSVCSSDPCGLLRKTAPSSAPDLHLEWENRMWTILSRWPTVCFTKRKREGPGRFLRPERVLPGPFAS
jgi:PAS domain S-box-containing protein